MLQINGQTVGILKIKIQLKINNEDTYNNITTLAHQVEQYPAKMCVLGSIPRCKLFSIFFNRNFKLYDIIIDFSV